MKKTIVLKMILGALCLAVSLTVVSEQSEQQGAAVPLRLEPTEIPYSRMRTDMPPWPDEDVLSGVSEHRYEYLYSGDINVAIYEAKPMKLRLEDYEIDEFVMVVSGTLILTADGGSPQRFDAGESVLVPKGFTGTWEMQGNFREMVVVMNGSKGQ
jgi:uncharacterized cupin superfamily protein